MTLLFSVYEVIYAVEQMKKLKVVGLDGIAIWKPLFLVTIIYLLILYYFCTANLRYNFLPNAFINSFLCL